jgi:hypothetical protein
MITARPGIKCRNYNALSNVGRYCAIDVEVKWSRREELNTPSAEN